MDELRTAILDLIEKGLSLKTILRAASEIYRKAYKSGK